MRDFLHGSRKRKLMDWLAINSSIDAGLYRAWIRIQGLVERLFHLLWAIRSERLSARRQRLACEGLTLGVGGLLVLLAFALPLFEVAQGNINLSDDTASPSSTVTATRSASAESQRRFGAARRAAGLPDQGDARDRGPALLRPFRRRRLGHHPRACRERARRFGRPGRYLDHPAARQALFLTPERSIDRKIKEALLRHLSGEALHQGRNPELYFDRAYMGGGYFGVAAASEFYFGKSVTDMKLSEGAMFAAFQGADALCAACRPRRLAARANQVLTNMVEAGSDRRSGLPRTGEPRGSSTVASFSAPTIPRLGVRGGEEAHAWRAGASISFSPGPPSTFPCRRWPSRPCRRPSAQFGRARPFRPGRACRHGDGRFRARLGRRRRLRRKPVQSRHPGLSSARLLVQRLRLPRGTRARLQGDLCRQRRLCELRTLVAEKLFGRVPRPHDS